jgi:hypothetical protein
MDIISFESIGKIDDRHLQSLFYSKKNELYRLYKSKASLQETNDVKFHLAVIQREMQIREKRQVLHKEYLSTLYKKR